MGDNGRRATKGNIVYAYDMDGNLLSETGGCRSAEYRYNGGNRMIYPEVTDHTSGAAAASEYAYDAFGRRTIVQDAGRTATRTPCDGFTFETLYLLFGFYLLFFVHTKIAVKTRRLGLTGTK